MGATAVVEVEAQVDERVRSQVQKVLDREGMSMSDAFQFFLERTALEDGIPSRAFHPNAETIAAMEAARRGEVTRVANFQQLIAEIEAEDD